MDGRAAAAPRMAATLSQLEDDIVRGMAIGVVFANYATYRCLIFLISRRYGEAHTDFGAAPAVGLSFRTPAIMLQIRVPCLRCGSGGALTYEEYKCV